MPPLVPQLRFALLTNDPDLKSKVDQRDLQEKVMVVENCLSLETAMESEDFAGVILDEPESRYFAKSLRIKWEFKFFENICVCRPPACMAYVESNTTGYGYGRA